MENDRLKGLIDDGTPLTKAILKMAEDYATGYQPPCNDVAKGWQGWGQKDEDKLSVECGVKEFTERSVIELTDNDLTFLKMCIYFMRDKLKADNKMYEETLFGLSYCTTPEPEKSVYENMINMNEKTITQCNEWLKRLEQV